MTDDTASVYCWKCGKDVEGEIVCSVDVTDRHLGHFEVEVSVYCPECHGFIIMAFHDVGSFNDN